MIGTIPPLSGRTALVTGAATGIGRATALALADAGARVVVNHLRQPEAAAEVVERIVAAGGEALAVDADVSRAGDVMALARQAEAFAGAALDILVNNAGIILERPFLELSEEEWDRIVAVDLKSVFLCCRALLPAMAARGCGTVINVASDLALLGRAGFAPYCAAKAGVIGLTRALAREFAPAIRINAVAPGPVDTAMVSAATLRPETLALELDNLQRRIAHPDEIARVILFLASDDASFVTGQTVGPNGGSVLT